MASAPELLLHALPMDSSMWQAQMGILHGATFAPTLYGFGDQLETWADEALKFAKGDGILQQGVGGRSRIWSGHCLPTGSE